MSHKQEASESDISGFAFNRKKIRYSVLDGLIDDNVLDTSVTMFVDMRYVLDIMRIEYYKDAVTRELVPNSNRVVAELLNLIVHYRRYFVEKRSCRTTFVLLFDAGRIDPFKAEANGRYGTSRFEKTVKPTYLGFVADKIQRIAPCIPDLKVVNSGQHELSCIPFIVADEVTSTHNVFLTDDPLIHQVSSSFRNFVGLRANGEHSRSVPRNRYFRYLFEKNKWAVKREDDTAIDDSYIRLFLNLTGGDDECPVDEFKNKKAVNLINKLRQQETRFLGYEMLKGHVSDDAIETMELRDVCYNALAHAASVDDAERLEMLTQYRDSGRTSRKEFNHYNLNYFGGVVDETVLFTTI